MNLVIDGVEEDKGEGEEGFPATRYLTRGSLWNPTAGHTALGYELQLREGSTLLR